MANWILLILLTVLPLALSIRSAKDVGKPLRNKQTYYVKEVLYSSLFLAVLHLYQGWKGLLSNLVSGLILGKLFLEEGSLFYPIIVHAMMNLPIVVLSYRRMKDLKRLKVEAS